jgi:hypothetical protein
MSSYTTNLGMTKPDLSEQALITTINNDLQLIDDTFATHTPTTQAVGDVADMGAAVVVARADHKHAMPSFGTGPADIATATANGSSANIARIDHVHKIGTGAINNPAMFSANVVGHSALNITTGSTPAGGLAVGDELVVYDVSGTTNAKTTAGSILALTNGDISINSTTGAATLATIADSKLATISTANKVDIAALNIDGGIDINSDIADADLFIVDDGGGGTNRTSAATRVAKYALSKATGDVTFDTSNVAAIAAGVIVNADINTSAAIAVTKLANSGTASALLRTNSAGNAVEWATSGQIVFPASQNSSADANTLDDYEEGSWTPTVLGATTAGTNTYSYQFGRYTKVGSMVQFDAFIGMATKGGTMAGTVYITLPFTAKNWGFSNGNGAISVAAGASVTLTTSYTQLVALVLPNTTYVSLQQVANGSAAAWLDTSNISGTFQLSLGGCYIASA